MRLVLRRCGTYICIALHLLTKCISIPAAASTFAAYEIAREYLEKVTGV